MGVLMIGKSSRYGSLRFLGITKALIDVGETAIFGSMLELVGRFVF